MTIQSKEIIFETDMETYLSELNIILLRDQKTMTNDNDLPKFIATSDKAKKTISKIRKNK